MLCNYFASLGEHYSNIIYNDMTIPFDVKDLNVGKNNYTDLIKGKYYKLEKIYKEGVPIMLSDLGLYAASHASGEVKQEFPSMAIAIAVWRHLYNAPVGFNVQQFSRVALIVREQANVFFNCVKTEVFKLFGVKIAITDLYYYQDIRGLEARIRPLEANLFDGQQRRQKIWELNLDRNDKYGEVRCIRLYQ
ncbi:MAG: hypothetical protein RSB20_00715, partial [Clostridia bacterium]